MVYIGAGLPDLGIVCIGLALLSGLSACLIAITAASVTLITVCFIACLML